MKRLIAIALACSPLGACAPVNSANVAVEQATTAANDFYTHASRAGEDLVKAGLLDKAKFQAADAKAYAILQKLRMGQATFAELAAATQALTGGQ